MKLDSREVELFRRVAQVIDGMVIIVKEDGLIRQVTSMDKRRMQGKISTENSNQLIDKTKRK